MTIKDTKEGVSEVETVDELSENEVLDNESNNIEDGVVDKLSVEETKDKKSFENLLKELNISKIDFYINAILVGIALVGLTKKVTGYFK